MGKLHELLAVEGDLKSAAQQTLRATLDVFGKGAQRLAGKTRVYQPLEESGQIFAPEVTRLATTTDAELAAFARDYGRWVDAAIQKEVTNQGTMADIEGVEGLLLSLPAPALLNLEARLGEVRRVYAAIPTNDPSEVWSEDEQNECYVSQPRTTYRTEKLKTPLVLYDATVEHPAQVQVHSEDVRVGTWVTTIQSGMLTPRDKRERLERIDLLFREVKRARQRANNTDVESLHLAEKLFSYIDGK